MYAQLALSARKTKANLTAATHFPGAYAPKSGRQSASVFR